ncbi:tol-pal system protein YbgF [Candidatus Kinetoplastibacterium oncopeltii TCC290E]|uniref:Tol-pal system protein YbgF n=1 Tax=Candidatus Kinetoplastidibacterium stringomonadis TCC290E TaxID=1208920 RepID=M1LZN5_9PROT|nr:tetratricopeptide repeat protein [Candidatus Kinetoplastibacterium oncopeltii]AGF48569.1 tol-pal system protein YbgF [Candidatus Kinetoplastibacterium oncopeltii TCC290E]
MTLRYIPYIRAIFIALVISSCMLSTTYAKNEHSYCELDLQKQIDNIKKSELQLHNYIMNLQNEIYIIRDQIELITNNPLLNNKSFHTKKLKKDEFSLKEKEHYDQSIKMFNKHEYIEAKNNLSSFIDIYNNSVLLPYARFYYGKCNYKLSKFKESIDQLIIFIKEKPDSEYVPEALLLIAENQIALNNITDATKTLKIILKNHKTSDIYGTAQKLFNMVR